MLRLRTLTLVQRGAILAAQPQLLDARVAASEHQRVPAAISVF
jgi:hypothetical protein